VAGASTYRPQIPMSTLASLQERLRQFEEVEVTADEPRLFAAPKSPDVFVVAFWQRDDEFTVSFGDVWHCEFDAEEPALACFWLGLSTTCRLRTYYWGPIPYRGMLETLEDGHWVPSPRVPYNTTVSLLSILGLLLWPWRRIQTSQNAVLPAT